jgi:hypothetical protein
VDVEDLAERGGDLGEPGGILGRLGRLAGLLAKTILLVEQGHERLAAELGEAIAIPLDGNSLPRAPAQAEVDPQEGKQRGRA